MSITPKEENKDKGFSYTVSDEQIREHRKRTIPEIFEWLESTSKFIYSIQTEEERQRMRSVKNS